MLPGDTLAASSGQPLSLHLVAVVLVSCALWFL